MQQPHQLRSDSPTDSSNTLLSHNHVSLKTPHTDSLFNLHSAQNQTHAMYNNIHDFAPTDHDVQKLQQSGKLNGYGHPPTGAYRQSAFAAFTNNTRPRHHTSNGLGSGQYRDASSAFGHPYPTAADVFGASGPALSHIASPTLPQQQTNSFETLHQGRGFDYNGNGSQPNGALNKQPYSIIDPYGNGSPSGLLQIGGNKSGGGMPPAHNGYTAQAPYVNGLHIQSQTPYGPHLQTNGPPSNGTNGGTSGAPPGINHVNGAGNPPNPANEEISTIFVVGFPEDMQEREFQNMFTFSQGFEAATLKIPNKEYTAYGGPGAPGSMRPGVGGISLNYPQTYSGSNDPYNLVTVNQGGVVVDGGRDGTTASWPAMQDDRDGGHFGPGPSSASQAMTMPPRKQIIGFAKFRSRAEALEARDILQGRRVDIEKGAVLKAEMAKKNLHTKRGVGPVPPVPMGAATGVGGAGGAGMGGIIPGEPLAISTGLGNGGIGVVGLSNGAGEAMSARERELGTLGAMGFGVGGLGQWREQRLPEGVVNREEEERERRREREREAGVINAMGLGNGTRGPRERAEDDERERERRRKETEGRLRSSNTTAFDAFHSVPPQASTLSRSNSNTAGSMLSPSGSVDNGNVSPMMGNGSVFMVQPQPEEAKVASAVLGGPWDMVMANGFSSSSRKQSVAVTSLPPRPPSSNRQSSPPLTNPSYSPTLPNANPTSHSGLPSRPRMSPSTDSHQQHFQQHYPLTSQVQGSSSHVPSSASSVAGGSQSSGDVEMSRALGGLAVSTSQGSTSPQLPSPASGSSGGRTNAIDQNPPINTLYVGNLPTTQMPSGYPPNYLEDSLRELFQRRPGFRKLCFRQKTNGPMCFVEFEDVNFAAKTLNELYGNTLNGLIKGGGIRLSYSKNPLGVRTPTSAGSGSSLQQQQSQSTSGSSPFPSDAFQPRSSMDMDVNRQPSNLRSPPPSSLSYTYMASQPPRFFSPTPSSATFPRSSIAPQHNYAPPSNNVTTSTFSPFGLSTPPPQHSSMIPDQSGADASEHHFSHHGALSPTSSNIEAAKAS